MPRISEQIEWLSLVDISGPFLATSVLEQVFPQGLEKVETPRRQRLRSAYEEWCDAVDEDDPLLSEMHSAWILMVLQDMLEYDDSVLVSRQALDGKCVYRAPEHGVEAMPEYVVRGEDGKYHMLISVWPPETDLEKPVSGNTWPASPLERMTFLCRANEVRVGLVTDGERWMVINAPIGATSGYSAWLARLWWQEAITLKAFQSLLGVRRCFGPKEETLDALLERSTEFQEEVTDTLGEQVRRAVEILIQSLGRADQDRNGELLKDVRPAELYEAGLTVMMRLVFTLCAEERGLLLLGDPTYDQHYAISTLRARLREDANQLGVEVLERRHDAWSRMLAVFRAIYGGVEHESLRMPSLGGSLFDPDRFPFLEGRARGTSWREIPAVPLPIDNRTVLLLLDALQVLEQRGGAQLLSYRALDVEQIGHVYEGLLEYTVAKLDNVTLGLTGSRNIRHPTISLRELETLKSQENEKTIEYLVRLTGRTASAIMKALTHKDDDDEALLGLVHASGGDETLARHLLPFAKLIRADSWGTMLVYKPGSFAVVHGSSRRETGTHYTPRSLTENIVDKTLEAIVYSGPSEGEPRERWKLKTAAVLLDLKICDPAMGSGAFIVQSCRYLSERLVEAWENEEIKGKSITVDGVVLDTLGKNEPMPKSIDERLILARRLIAERSIYGVDINPLAVELAKLSIWLVTMAKGRPFGFLDHNLRVGDSLLGIHRIDQLTKLHIDPDSTGCQPRLFGRNIENAVGEALTIRNQLHSITIRDIRDVEVMSRLNSRAQKRLESVDLVADAMIGTILSKSGQLRELSVVMDSLAVKVGDYLNGNFDAGKMLARDSHENLSLELPEGMSRRTPLHWPLAFPEVFSRDKGGFDAIVGNPPFLGGRKISTNFGEIYEQYIKYILLDGQKGTVNFVLYFLIRAESLLASNGSSGFLAVDTIRESESRSVGMEILLNRIILFRAISSIPWPGTASVYVSIVHGYKGKWNGVILLDGREVPFITSQLQASVLERKLSSPFRLKSNQSICSDGVKVQGIGFVINSSEYNELIKANSINSEVISQYIVGDDLNNNVNQLSNRRVINYWSRPQNEAERYSEPWQILVERVKPYRDGLTKQVHENCFWKFWDRREDFFNRIRTRDRFLVASKLSKYFAVSFGCPIYIYSEKVKVFDFNSYSAFAILQSTFHIVWSIKWGSSMGGGLAYTGSGCFDTFPFPECFYNQERHRVLRFDGKDELCEVTGKNVYDAIRVIGVNLGEGLTDIYNLFHNQGEESKDIVKLRALHVEMDYAVAYAYGWNDLDLGHGFYETKQGVRYTISPPARSTILDRLLALNHQRYEEEVKAGLHDKKKPKSINTNESNKKNVKRCKQEVDLFEDNK